MQVILQKNDYKSLSLIIKEIFGEDITNMGDHTEFVMFSEWDSLTHMIFITQLEEAYEIEFSGEEIANLKTIGALKKILQEKSSKPQ